MINFGDYAITGSVTHQFKKAPGWWWKIKPITSGAELEMARFIYRNRDVTDAHGNVTHIPPMNLEIAHREIALLFGGTNIPADANVPVEQGGKPFIPDGASVDVVENALIQMPREMVLELWAAIAEANPDAKWGPELPKVKKETPESDGSES